MSCRRFIGQSWFLIPTAAFLGCVGTTTPTIDGTSEAVTGLEENGMDADGNCIEGFEKLVSCYQAGPLACAENPAGCTGQDCSEGDCIETSEGTLCCVGGQWTPEVCEERCVPIGGCEQGDDCDRLFPGIAMFCQNCQLIDGMMECGHYGVCVELPPEQCEQDDDCIWNDGLSDQTGRCFNATCNYDPFACLMPHDCEPGLECYFRPCEPMPDPANDEPGMTDVCPDLGTCVPVGDGTCSPEKECPPGELCQNCRYSEEEGLVCEHFGVCIPEPPFTCTDDIECVWDDLVTLQQGRCFVGTCVYSDNACDDGHPCPADRSCDIPCWCEPDPTDPDVDPTGQQCNVPVCASYGECT